MLQMQCLAPFTTVLVLYICESLLIGSISGDLHILVQSCPQLCNATPFIRLISRGGVHRFAASLISARHLHAAIMGRPSRSGVRLAGPIALGARSGAKRREEMSGGSCIVVYNIGFEYGMALPIDSDTSTV